MIGAISSQNIDPLELPNNKFDYPVLTTSYRAAPYAWSEFIGLPYWTTYGLIYQAVANGTFFFNGPNKPGQKNCLVVQRGGSWASYKKTGLTPGTKRNFF